MKSRFFNKIACIGAGVIVAGFSAGASAGEGLFSRTYTTDTTPQGQFEFEQMFRDRNGRAHGSYNAIDSATEIEYGVTDKFQAALYLNTGRIDANNAPDDDDPLGNGALGTGFSRHRTFVEGISAEFIYRVLSPYTDGIGLAFYIEPEFNFNDLHNGLQYDDTFATEYKVLVQKNFLDDQLVLAYNLELETEAVRFKYNEEYNSELDFNNDLGISYRVRPNWFVGLEARNHNEYGNFNHHEHTVVWVGPVIHYGGQKAWATLGWLEQVYGTPSGEDADSGYSLGNNRFLRSHERHEITFKVGIPF